jgi:hypothetical protein
MLSATQARTSALNVSVNPKVLKADTGRVWMVVVTVAGTTTGSINDCTTTAAASAGNTVMLIPNTVGTYELDWPMLAGIVVKPGTGQTVCVAYS